MYITKIKHQYDTFDLNIAEVALPKNKIIGLVGDNGAGKTTLMSILSGFLQANMAFTVRDYEVDNILFIPSALKLYDYLTVREFVTFMVRQGTAGGNEGELLEKLQLADKQDTIISDLSQGMQKKLSLINIFVKDYQFLILDEPFNSIDVKFIYDLKAELRAFSQRSTILISSHILDTLRDLCDAFIYLKDGSVVKQFANDDQHVLERELFESSNEN